MERRYMGLFLVLFLVLAPQEVVGEGEGRMCESESQKFKGICMSSLNCGLACPDEGFKGSKCKGFWRRCFCTKPCGEKPPPGEEPPYGAQPPYGEQPPPLRKRPTPGGAARVN
ncbi:hypothetical protein NL676_027276 [Syzygium grande]|nr:hypothetical protein NL676_027276 [Syzygium grande]